MKLTTRVAATALSLSLFSACGNPVAPQEGANSENSGPARTWNVAPTDDFAKVVAQARAGDTILLGPGIYTETLRIDKPDLNLVGVSRNDVVIDGEVLRANGIVVTADRVTVANLTVRNALLNGVLVTGMSDDSGGIARGSQGYEPLDPEEFPPIQGVHIDHVTSYNNGLYGIYLFDAQHGLVENTYTSGGADSGVYVGQCKPCNIVVRNNIMERNAVGYEHTNAGPEVWVVGNRMTNNRVGATINSNHQEAFLPQEGATFVGNLLSDNDYPQTPEQGDGGFAIGLGIGGGTDNLVAKNRIIGHRGAGIMLASVDDLPVTGNTVRDNQLAGNGYDLVVRSTDRSPDRDNCFADNTARRTSPPQVIELLRCGRAGKAVGVGNEVRLPAAPRGIAFTDVAAPPKLPGLDDPLAVEPWTIDQVPTITVDQVKVPAPNYLR